MELEMKMVSPPEKAPVQSLAASLGLVRGLRVETAHRQYRCEACSRMQPRGSYEVWVPDWTQRNDPAWAIEERCRESAYNGSWTAWCLSCAPKAPRPPRSADQRVSLWARLWRFLTA
jgi:hypothetical protein